MRKGDGLLQVDCIQFERATAVLVVISAGTNLSAGSLTARIADYLDETLGLIW
jgi:hypothetical protein